MVFVNKIFFCVMDYENIAYPGGFLYFADYFGHKKYNSIWKMPSVLLNETEAVDLEGQEQWPDDAKLYQPHEKTQILLPDYANCLAVQAYLKMSGLSFEIVEKHNAEFMSPSGRVPFIKCGGFMVSELEPIITFLMNKGININVELSPEELADMRAYMSLVNNVLLNAELYMCWCDDKTYENVTFPRYGSVFAWPLNHFVTWGKRRQIKKRLSLLGWGQKQLSQIIEDVDNCCLSLSNRLEGNEYFFGSKPTGLDALFFGHIFSILTISLPNNILSQIVRKYKNLIKLCNRIDETYFKSLTS